MASIPLSLSKKAKSSEIQTDGMCGRSCIFSQLRMVHVLLDKEFSEHRKASSTNS